MTGGLTAAAAASSDHDRVRAGSAPGRSPGRGGRAEQVLGAALPVALGVGVFCVAFVHVHDVAAWAGQPDWAAWLIAVSVELMALASIVEIRHRRRAGTPIRWPVVTLVAGVGMSGAANLTAAGPDALTGPAGGWVPTMALWPVAAFGLVAGLKATRPTRPILPAPAMRTTPPVEPDRPPADRTPTDPDRTDRSDRAEETGPRCADRAEGGGETGPRPPGVPAELLAAGRAVAVDLARHGRPVTRTALARGVRQRGHRCSTDRAALLLTAVRADPPQHPAAGPPTP